MLIRVDSTVYLKHPNSIKSCIHYTHQVELDYAIHIVPDSLLFTVCGASPLPKTGQTEAVFTGSCEVLTLIYVQVNV